MEDPRLQEVPKLKAQYGREIERMNKALSLTAHPEWQWYVDTYINTARDRFEKEAHRPEFRESPEKYVNIVRALEKVTLYEALLADMYRDIDRGREAQKGLDNLNG